MSRKPPRLGADPPWMRLGPAGDTPDAGDAGEILFRRAMAGVTPLGRPKSKTPRTRLAAAAKPLPAPEGRRHREPAKPVPDKPIPAIDRAALFAGSRDKRRMAATKPGADGHFADLDGRTADKLRRGRLTIDARLDLHGLTQRAAHAAVIRCLDSARAAGLRTVLVITGTGLRQKIAAAGRAHRDSGGAPPGVLRDALPRWLAQPPLAGTVLALSRARLDHGGDGAFYVLLRRTRR